MGFDKFEISQVANLNKHRQYFCSCIRNIFVIVVIVFNYVCLEEGTKQLSGDELHPGNTLEWDLYLVLLEC